MRGEAKGRKKPTGLFIRQPVRMGTVSFASGRSLHEVNALCREWAFLKGHTCSACWMQCLPSDHQAHIDHCCLEVHQQRRLDAAGVAVGL